MLRPTLLYGEGESSIVAGALKFADVFGSLPFIGSGESGRYQLMYAGNLAALMVKSWRSLIDKPNEFSGEMFYCNENTPCVQLVDYLRPFLELTGRRVSTMKFNYYLATFTMLFLEIVCGLLYRCCGIKLGQNLPSYKTTQMYAAWCFGYTTRKMRLFLDFTPPYKPDAAMESTIAWWKAKFEEKSMQNSQRTSNALRRG